MGKRGNLRSLVNVKGPHKLSQIADDFVKDLVWVLLQKARHAHHKWMTIEHVYPALLSCHKLTYTSYTTHCQVLKAAQSFLSLIRVSPMLADNWSFDRVAMTTRKMSSGSLGGPGLSPSGSR